MTYLQTFVTETGQGPQVVHVRFSPKATELSRGSEMTLRAKTSRGTEAGAAPSVHGDPCAGCTVQQPLEMEAGELIVGVFTNMRCKGRDRAGIARFQLGKRLQITLCRGILVLLDAEAARRRAAPPSCPSE